RWSAWARARPISRSTSATATARRGCSRPAPVSSRSRFTRAGMPPDGRSRSKTGSERQRASHRAAVAVSAAVRRLIITLEPAERARPELERIDGIEVLARYELSKARDPSVLAGRLAGERAWATVAGSEPYTGSVFAAVPDLKAVLRWGTGSDAIDIAAATEAGVAVITTP